MRVENITPKELKSLQVIEKKILFLFIKKKFKISPNQRKTENIIIPKVIKTKRNEEILKFVLKGFFKYLCKQKVENDNLNFFKLKKQICL